MRTRGEFARVQRQGKRRVGRHVVVLTLDRPKTTKVGIMVGKAVGTAVARNRVRRRLKAVLDRLALGEPPYRSLLLIARPGADVVGFAELAGELDRLIQ